MLEKPKRKQAVSAVRKMRATFVATRMMQTLTTIYASERDSSSCALEDAL
jgi:hypothetical protein